LTPYGLNAPKYFNYREAKKALKKENNPQIPSKKDWWAFKKAHAT